VGVFVWCKRSLKDCLQLNTTYDGQMACPIVQAAMNMHNAPVEMGLYGEGCGRLWCRSGTETLHFWGWSDAAAEPEREANEMEQEGTATPEDMVHMLDAREQLTKQIDRQASFRGGVCTPYA
jgi:hypothetical protein